MIFVTGGAGYIGSHTCVELLNAGFDVTVFDNFCNSQPEALARVERITGKKPGLVQGDIRDSAALLAALRASGATAVIHFAGLKAVGESVQSPLAYYDNNVAGISRHCSASNNMPNAAPSIWAPELAIPVPIYDSPDWRGGVNLWHSWR